MIWKQKKKNVKTVMVQVKLNLIVITFLMSLQNPKHQLKNVKDVMGRGLKKPTKTLNRRRAIACDNLVVELNMKV